MANITIDEFWVERLGTRAYNASTRLVRGWSFEDVGLNTFWEAPLTLSTEEFGSDVDPGQSSVLIVSAPGAVGKSTLARQIAYRTGSVYVNLADADPVGGNTLSGWLVKSGLYSAWENQEITVLIDGLDEAGLKTTKEAFEAFLSDVAELSVTRDIPTVWFGRTGAVQDAWLILSEHLDDQVAVLEIGFYSYEESIDFAEAKLQADHPDRNHPLVDRHALTLLLKQLRSQTEKDGDRFSGYAPVLQAVAERVASESNPSTLVSEMEQGGQQTVTLQSVVRAILLREQNKLKDLAISDPELLTTLYNPEEQLDRLAARIYNTPPPELPEMCHGDAEIYSTALESWEGGHPFLDRDSTASSVVFEAAISAQAFKNATGSDYALQKELDKGEAANPFLYEFYLGGVPDNESVFIPEKHIGVIYSSLRAGLARGDSARLSIAEFDAEDGEPPTAGVEIELFRRNKDQPAELQFSTGQSGPIYFGAHVKDVTVEMPSARVEIGRGNEVVLVAPIEIQCQDLAFWAERVIADNPPGSEAKIVLLQAETYSGTPISTLPVARNGATMLVSWDTADKFPWNRFAYDQPVIQDDDPRVDEALRRFRKFVVAFSSHGYGVLAQSRNKIESPRMTKGTGQAVLDEMLKTGIVSRDQTRYNLDAGRLGELTETTYRECMTYQFGPKAVAFVHEALNANRR